MPPGIVLRWITPASLTDPALKEQRARISKVLWFTRRMDQEDPAHGLTQLFLWRKKSQITETIRRGGVIILALQNQTPVGCLLFRPVAENGYVTYFTAVRPAFRNQKIARNLSLALLRYVRNRGGGVIERALQTTNSILWHQKWADKKPRVRIRKGEDPTPLEGVQFIRTPIRAAKISVFANDAPFPGLRSPHMERKPVRRKRKPGAKR